MDKIISAVVVDPKFIEHDYSNITTTPYYVDEETYIKCEVVSNINDDEHLMGLLSQSKGFDAIITIGNNINFEPLNNMPIEFRKKWVHLEEFNVWTLVNSVIATLSINMDRHFEDMETFSIFTSAYNMTDEMFNRLYDSLLAQTYRNWNWYILDDGEKGYDWNNIKDPRVKVFKNITNHGCIGFNKRAIAMMCDGNYLVEVDHDDELLPDCLMKLHDAFKQYNADFVYSYALELFGDEPVWYTEDFALGLGTYEIFNVKGKDYKVATTPDINALSLRHIVSLPNHVRCWRKEFYHKIGGHNADLSVLDDMELLIRTFIKGGTMVKIPEVLYIQHRGNTAQDNRYGEILRLGRIIRKRYDREIHDVVVSKCGLDPVWDEKIGESNLNFKDFDKLTNFNHTFGK